MGNSRSRRACVEALATRIAGPMSSGSRVMGRRPHLISQASTCLPTMGRLLKSL